jgi:5-methyltetrahydropteroyltriglutamate--homocysteine methyltransferase
VVTGHYRRRDAAIGGGDKAMKTSTSRILTTHTGSLPRPAGLDRDDPAAVRAAVAETVRHQVRAGVDIVSDGETAKPSYATYVTERLAGFGGPPSEPVMLRDLAPYPEYMMRLFADPAMEPLLTLPGCVGPVAYTGAGRARLAAGIEHLQAATDDATETFMSAASPGVIAMFLSANRYYPGTDAYVFALAEAMKTEYDAIHAAGLVLQLDAPDLALGWHAGPEQTLEEFRRAVAWRIEALNWATRDIPAEQMRIHLCWGNYAGPHHLDLPLADIIDLVLAARPAAISFEAANPRHAHEWRLFEEDVKLPDGKVIIPGVIDSTTNYIEHPEAVAERLFRYASLVGRENVLAGSDCGFGTFSGWEQVDAKIVWAKLEAMADGARLASSRMWPGGARRFLAGSRPQP